ncbi:MAG: WYL domain-containing protein, partial [Clostridia bacterium]|nr:WYL domain-containing protein [Clostridia bacterium]
MIKLGEKMVIQSNKKMSLLCILEVLREHSDENHPLTQAQIISKIANRYGLELERKSIGANIDSLIDFGFDIVKTEKGCYLGQREFEPSEVSFLIDAVFSSRSIDSKRSRELAEKISKFLSVNERKKYKYICKSDEIIRTDNKQLFYTIDILNEAIEKCKKVQFNYNRFYFDKETREKKNTKPYVINPYFLINNQGKYYLVCNYDYYDEIANYKVELISNIKIL